MFEVIRACRQADFVIVDGPPIEPVADSLVLADLVDGVLLVADARGTRAGVSNARQQLEQVGGSILGGVLNRVPESRTPEAYGAYEQRRGLADRSRSDDDADRELASLREEASRSPETSAWV
jgi:Mrp family chromosome partitioning ATPase